jgi:ABC-2 type transport system permease protein
VADQLRIYAHLVAASIRSDAQYRVSFVLYLLAQALVAGFDLAVVLVLFANTGALAGWTAEEVVLLFGLTGMSFGLGDVLVSEVELAGRHIQAGTFDKFLIRPAGPLIQLCATEFALRRLGRVLQPLAVLAVVLPRLDVDWDPARVLLVPVAVVSGATIFGALWVMTSSISFWTIGSREVANAFTYGGNHLSQYPIDVLGGWLRHLVVFVVPVAFVSYLPAAWLLGKPPVLALPSWTGLTSPVVAAGLALVARAVWHTAIRHYRSTGS